jgi:hypothetical protein
MTLLLLRRNSTETPFLFLKVGNLARLAGSPKIEEHLILQALQRDTKLSLL